MILETRRAIFATSKRGKASASIIGRLDRIPIWSLPTLFIGIIGVGYLFTFYDIFDINVSFIQTCTQIVPGCTPATAGQYLGAPVLLNLLGYVLGTLILSPLADRYGRRDMLVITIMITALGSLWTAFAGDYTSFIIGRILTGIGIGADLSIVNTYVNEMAPRAGRAKYASLIFIMSSLGAVLAIWLGLYLTTPAAPFPLGLPFALAGPHFTIGWHIMYIVGALLAVAGLTIRYELPESARWLISKGRIAEAERVVSHMELLATKRIFQLPPPSQELPGLPHADRSPYLEIVGNALY
jgi:MFS transporter, putative metabolite:H+ symporter